MSVEPIYVELFVVLTIVECIHLSVPVEGVTGA